METPPPTASERRTPLLAAGVASAGALLLGLVGIGRSFGYDEGYTYYFFINGGSVRRALTTQVVFNNHPMFSAIQSVAWRLGLTGETPQRLGPVLCGALAVGVVVWYVTRRAGLVGGVATGVVLVLNTVFLDNVRQLRGYALATAAVVVAAIAIRESWSDRRMRWPVIQAVAMIIAVTTHAYSAVTIAMLAAAALVLGRVERRHVITWAVAAVSALVIMSPLLDDMRTNADARGNRYFDSFPIDLTRALTGQEWPAVVVTLAAVAVGAWEVGRRSTRHAGALAAAAGILLAVVLLLWQVVQPYDLYFRFFVSVLPFVAVLAGLGIARVPTVVGAAAVAVLVVTSTPAVRDVLDAEPTFREAAQIVDRARSQGLDVCGRHVEPLFVYTPPMPLVSGLGDFGDCEVYVSVLRMSPEARESAGARFSGEAPLGGSIIVWADAGLLDGLVEQP